MQMIIPAFNEESRLPDTFVTDLPCTELMLFEVPVTFCTNVPPS